MSALLLLLPAERKVCGFFILISLEPFNSADDVTIGIMLTHGHTLSLLTHRLHFGGN